MKKLNLWMMALALVATSTMFTACHDDDDDKDPSFTVTFEDKALNAEGYWNGDKIGEGTPDGNGGTTWASTYTEGPLTLNINLTESPYYNYWSGFAISSRTAKEFVKLTPDQYNNVTGKAHSGKNFIVAQPYGETIDINIIGGAVIESLWYTNSSYAYHSMKNGDDIAGEPFDKNDYFTCVITGVDDEMTARTVELDLASNGKILKEWKKANLRSLGKVTYLTISFKGSRANDYGLLTPTYICLDDIKVQLPNTNSEI